MKKSKSLLRRVLMGALFFALLLGTLAYVSGVMERKASRTRFEPFLREPEDIDVLFVGDSLVVNGVFPMEIWQDYGIAAYNLASYGNTLPVTYWTLMNALKTASPRLVVVGVKDVERGYKLTGSSSDVHTALDCYPLSATKVRAVFDLMDDPEAVDDSGTRYADMKWEYLFTLGKYHSRWSELSTSDFGGYTLNRQKGAETGVGVADARDYDLIDEEQAAEENGWGYVYLRRILDECAARNIEVLLMHLPYPAGEAEQMAANAVRCIAEEYGVNYIDFVSQDDTVDYAADCWDERAHLNASGARKVSDYLGRYITEHYDVPDRRGQEGWLDWNEDAAVYARDKDELLRGQKTLENVLMLLHDDDYSACILVRDAQALLESDKLRTLMHNTVREHVYEEDAFSKWSNAMFPLEALESAGTQPYALIIDRTAGAFAELTGSGLDEGMAASFGEAAFAADDAGVSVSLVLKDGQAADAQGADACMLIVRAQTGELVAAKGFSLEE